jgi:hypothetical protein
MGGHGKHSEIFSVPYNTPKKIIPINSFSLVQAKTCVRTATRLRVGARHCGTDSCWFGTGFHSELSSIVPVPYSFIESCIPNTIILTAIHFSMQKARLFVGRKSVFRMLVAFGLIVLVPSLYAQQNKAGSDSPQTAWSNIQQFVKDMETAVQSKNCTGSTSRA